MEKVLTDLISTFDFTTFSKEEIEGSKNMMNEHDVTILKKIMEDKINKWKKQGINCGITEASGCGKSSFINAMRNLLAEDKGAAMVDVNETTTEPTPYQDPNNPKINYWDLPGVGTPKFPKNETYLDKIGFERYDFFLLISADRFTETDIWLAEQIRSANKSFYFVRTKLDQDLRNKKRNYPKTYNEETVRESIKNATIKSLEIYGFKNPKVYLISNNNQQLYDFPQLIIELANSLPTYKREALTLSIHAFSKEVILEKKKLLEKNIYYLSALSALITILPETKLFLTADFDIILNAISDYRHQFGLEDQDLTKYNLSEGKIDLIKKSSIKEVIIKLFQLSSPYIATEEAARYVPITKILVASSLSFYTTFAMLSTLLSQMAEASVELMQKKFDLMLEESEYELD